MSNLNIIEHTLLDDAFLENIKTSYEHLGILFDKTTYDTQRILAEDISNINIINNHNDSFDTVFNPNALSNSNSVHNIPDVVGNAELSNYNRLLADLQPNQNYSVQCLDDSISSNVSLLDESVSNTSSSDISLIRKYTFNLKLQPKLQPPRLSLFDECTLSTFIVHSAVTIIFFIGSFIYNHFFKVF